MITEEILLTYSELRKRGEMSFLGDNLVEVGENAVMCSGTDYTEVRNFKRLYYMMRFSFVTHSYSSYMETIIADLYQRPADVIIMLIATAVTGVVTSYFYLSFPRFYHLHTYFYH